MGRKLEINWQHTEDELYDAYKAADDLDARSRYQAMWLLKRGKSLSDVAHDVAHETAVSYRTVQRWKTWYNAGGLDKLLENSHGGRREVPRRLTNAQRDRLVEEIETGRFMDFEEIKDWVMQTFGVEYTESGIRSMYYRLRMHLADGPLRRAARKYLSIEEEEEKEGSDKHNSLSHGLEKAVASHLTNTTIYFHTNQLSTNGF